MVLIRQDGLVKPWPRDAVEPRYRLTYLSLDGWEYWTTGAPVAETTVINRAAGGSSADGTRAARGWAPWVEAGRTGRPVTVVSGELAAPLTHAPRTHFRCGLTLRALPK